MTTCGCGAPTGDGTTLCPRCTNRLAHDLRDVAGMPHPDGRPSLELAAQLEVVLARQTAYGERAGGRSAERPLPYDPRASEAAWVLRDTLANVARAIAPEPAPERPETATERLSQLGSTDGLSAEVSAARIARSLTQRLDTIRRHPEAYLLADEIHAAVVNAKRVIDRPPDRWYAGRCPCETDLYAKAGASTVTCPGCGTVYDVATRRAELLAAVEDRLATATEIARALTALATPVTPDAIRGYAHRGRLTQRGTTVDGRPLYRVGDVIDLVIERKARTA